GSVRLSLTLDEVDKFERLLAQLTSHYRFKDKLSALAELCVKIARAVFIDGTLNLDVAKIEQNMNKFILVSDVTTDALQAIRKDNASILSIMAVMLLIAHRKETYCYNTKTLLQTSINGLKLQGYDLEQI